MAKGDKEGKTTLLKMWTKAEDDQYGLLARDERLVNLAEDAVGKPVYLYSHKMTMKQLHEGGAWDGIRISAIGTTTAASRPR